MEDNQKSSSDEGERAECNRAVVKCLFAEAGVGHGRHAVAHGPDLVPEHQTRDDKPSLVAPLPRKCNFSPCAATAN